MGRAACLLKDEPVHIYVAAHVPLSHSGVPFDIFLPPLDHAYSANAQMFLLVDWHEHLHPVVISPLKCQAQKELAADGPFANHHLDAPA